MPRYWNEPILTGGNVARQHFVPRFLLRQFAIGGVVQVCEVETGRTFVATPENIGVEIGYYDIEIEEEKASPEGWLSELESEAASIVSRLASAPDAPFRRQ